MKNTLDWFALPARNLNRAAAFYTALLAAPVKVENFGAETIGVFPHDDPGMGGNLNERPDVTPLNGEFHLYFGVEDVDAAIACASGAGGALVSAPEDTPAGVQAAISDSEGNVVWVHRA